MGDSLCSCDEKGEIEPKSGTAEQEKWAILCAAVMKNSRRKTAEENFDDEQQSYSDNGGRCRKPFLADEYA